MGQNKYNERDSATVYEIRHRSDDAAARFLKLGNTLCALGLAVGLPAVMWGIHEMGRSGNPWFAIGSGAGMVIAEATGARIIYSKT